MAVTNTSPSLCHTEQNTCFTHMYLFQDLPLTSLLHRSYLRNFMKLAFREVTLTKNVYISKS